MSMTLIYCNICKLKDECIKLKFFKEQIDEINFLNDVEYEIVKCPDYYHQDEILQRKKYENTERNDNIWL